jgi:hypothetical protein
VGQFVDDRARGRSMPSRHRAKAAPRSLLPAEEVLCRSIVLIHTHIYVWYDTQRGLTVATNLAIDDNLIEEARRIGGHVTKKAAVTAALDEYIRRRKQVEILKLFGTIEYEPSYDYQANRRRDRIEEER